MPDLSDLSFAVADAQAAPEGKSPVNPLGEPLDLYNYPDVINTGLHGLGKHTLSSGKHRLTIEITGANASAVKAHMVGLDFVQLVPTPDRE